MIIKIVYYESLVDQLIEQLIGIGGISLLKFVLRFHNGFLCVSIILDRIEQKQYKLNPLLTRSRLPYVSIPAILCILHAQINTHIFPFLTLRNTEHAGYCVTSTVSK